MNRRLALDNILKHTFFRGDSTVIAIQKHPIASKQPEVSRRKSIGVLVDSRGSSNVSRQQGAWLQEHASPRLSRPVACSDAERDTPSNVLYRMNSLNSDQQQAWPAPSLTGDRDWSSSTISVFDREELDIDKKKHIETKFRVPKSGLFSQAHLGRTSSKTSLVSLKSRLTRKEAQKDERWGKENAIQVPMQDKHSKNISRQSRKQTATQPSNQTDEWAVTEGIAPIGMSRPTPIIMSPLHPQTHKMTHGQLTILQSRSLLIDFREGERRRGNKGREVLLVNADGSQVKCSHYVTHRTPAEACAIQIEVYNAPHLSSPCCLVEPTSVYPISKLPVAYWKQYSDASRAIEQVKRKTIEVIIRTPLPIESSNNVLAGVFRQ